ncbi:hypothetical protein B0H17DRAFT_1148726 [Mycena rosella]|uniref:Uncharacterized protein n=1 Tax=Mycena rosella TaxID=1033263 RepID=A0AAD7C9F7_MYCRO|nr:hypothetical protein B0H17DRAFT_1148726 [Mycena rosella]
MLICGEGDYRHVNWDIAIQQSALTVKNTDCRDAKQHSGEPAAGALSFGFSGGSDASGGAGQWGRGRQMPAAGDNDRGGQKDGLPIAPSPSFPRLLRSRDQWQAGRIGATDASGGGGAYGAGWGGGELQTPGTGRGVSPSSAFSGAQTPAAGAGRTGRGGASGGDERLRGWANTGGASPSVPLRWKSIRGVSLGWKSRENDAPKQDAPDISASIIAFHGSPSSSGSLKLQSPAFSGAEMPAAAGAAGDGAIAPPAWTLI